MHITDCSVQAKKRGVEGNIVFNVSKCSKKYVVSSAGFIPKNFEQTASFIENTFKGQFENREAERYLARELIIGINGLFDITDLLNTDLQIMGVYGNKRSNISREDIRALVMPLFKIVSESDGIIMLRYQLNIH